MLPTQRTKYLIDIFEFNIVCCIIDETTAGNITLSIYFLVGWNVKTRFVGINIINYSIYISGRTNSVTIRIRHTWRRMNVVPLVKIYCGQCWITVAWQMESTKWILIILIFRIELEILINVSFRSFLVQVLFILNKNVGTSNSNSFQIHRTVFFRFGRTRMNLNLWTR